MAAINLPIRQYRVYTDLDVPAREENFGYVERQWPLPAEQTGLVLIDCWDRHYMQSHLERNLRIVQERLLPVVQACRKAGIAIIHAPSPQTAMKYPQWLRYADDDLLFGREVPAPDWPPQDFVRRRGEYAVYAPPEEPSMPQILRDRVERRIMPVLEPEPEDLVVVDGAQLHRLCRHRRILHLLYAGFAANICVLNRDYGIRAMSLQRRYDVILIRDCTSAVETHDTVQDELMLKIAVRTVEMDFGNSYGASTTAQGLIEACAAMA
jgi:hypothetical protein